MPATSIVQHLAAASLETVVAALKQRLAWSAMREALDAHDLKKGGGWADLLGNASNDEAFHKAAKAIVDDLWLNLIGAGSRYIQLYDVDDAAMVDIFSRVAAGSTTENDFSARYPLPLSGNELAGVGEDYALSEVRHLESGDVQLIFSARRANEEKLVLDANSSPTVIAALGQAFGAYDHWVGYKQVRYQVFDTITIRPKLRRVELALDLAQRRGVADLQVEAMRLLGAASQTVPELRPIYEANAPVNLFPAIGEIYIARKAADLDIAAIGSRTPSGAILRMKMPSKEEDLREEDFFKAGAAAVNNRLKLYGIEATWTLAFPPSLVQTKLWVSASTAAGTDPHLSGFELTGAIDDRESVQAVNKVVKHL